MGEGQATHSGGASRSVGLNAAALMGARLLSMALNLVQVAIIFRALGAEGFGEFSFATNYPALFTAFATLGVQRLLTRDIARNPEITWRHAWTALALVTCLSAAVMAIIAGSIFVIEPNDRVRAAVILGAVWVVALYALQQPFESILTARERLTAVALINVVSSAIKLAAIFVVLRYTATSAAAQGTIAAANVVSLALFVGAAVAIAGWERPRVDLKLALRQARDCLPFLSAMILSLIYFKSDLTILRFMKGDAATGIYGGVVRITEPLMMLAGVWATAVFPALCRLSKHAPENFLALQRSTARMALLLAMPMAFGLAILAQPVAALLSGLPPDDTAQMARVLRIMCIAIPFFYFNGIGQEILYASHRNWLVPWSYGLAAGVSVLGNLVAIPLWGPAGSAAAAVAANVAITVLFASRMRDVLDEARLIPLAVKTMIASAVMAGAAYILAPWSLTAGIAAGAAVYLAAQHFLGTLNPEERGIIAGALHGVTWRR